MKSSFFHVFFMCVVVVLLAPIANASVGDRLREFRYCKYQCDADCSHLVGFALSFNNCETHIECRSTFSHPPHAVINMMYYSTGRSIIQGPGLLGCTYCKSCDSCLPSTLSLQMLPTYAKTHKVTGRALGWDCFTDCTYECTQTVTDDMLAQNQEMVLVVCRL